MIENRRRKTASRRPSASKPQRTTGQMPDQGSSNTCTSATTVDALPREVLLHVFQKLGFPHRVKAAAAVCHAWRDLASDAAFTRHVTGSINGAVQAAQPGDTVIIPSGFYNETVLVDRPLRLVGEKIQNLRGVPRRSVVIQSRRSMAVLCNAQTCLESVTVRTLAGSDNRSIVAFGPECPCIALYDCDVAGSSGLMIPATKDGARLALRNCSIHSVLHPIAAVAINAGSAILRECSLYSNELAVEVLKSARILMCNCDVSFNKSAMQLDGNGLVKDCVFWGNGQVMGSGRNSGREALFADSLPGSGSGPIPGSGSEYRAALATTAATDRPSSGSGRVVRGVGSASGMFFSGNHVRSNQHVGSVPVDAEDLRRKVRQLTRETYGSYAPDYDHWEVLGDTDIDTDLSTDEDEQSDTSEDSEDSEDSDDSMSSSGFDTDSSDSDSLDSLGPWITDSGGNSGSSNGGNAVAQMADVLMGGAISGASDDENDWDPGASS